MQYMYIFFYSKGFIRFENMDCLAGQDFHTLDSNDYPNYVSCRTYCNDNVNCRAFTVFENTCYFKNGDCQNDVSGLSGATTFIIQGEVKEIKAR